MPYVVMIVILLVRPYGLFGTTRGRGASDGAGRTRTSTRRYADELKLFRVARGEGVAGRCSIAAVAAAADVPRPTRSGSSVLNYAGIAAIGAHRAQPADRLHRPGLARPRVLHRRRRLHRGRASAATSACRWSLWLPAAALFGALVGALIGPFALRLRGNYLAIVTLGLVFLGEHLFRNMRGRHRRQLRHVGRRASATLGPIDFDAVTILGDEYIRNQGWFWLIWGLVALVRAAGQEHRPHAPGPGDPGDPRPRRGGRDRRRRARALQGRARSRSRARFAALAGALYGAYQQYVSPDEWTLFLSIQYIAIIIVGGVGTIFGAVLGALFLGGLPGRDRELLATRSRASRPAPATTASSRSSRSTRPSSAC